VGSGGELLRVVQSCPHYDGAYQRQNIYMMDFVHRQWTVVSMLRSQVLLLGQSHFAASFPTSEVGVEDSCVYIVTPEMPMYVHDVKSLFSQLFHRRPDDPTLSRMCTLATYACG
jgi:hypothetical protein